MHVCTYLIHLLLFTTVHCTLLLQGGYDAGYLYQYSMTDMEVGQPAEPTEPKESVPLPPIAGRDTPLTAITFRYSGELWAALCVYKEIRRLKHHHCIVC